MKNLIEFKNIKKQYKANHGIVEQVLNDISFEVKEGEFLSIMGPSGSGKSTCMNILGCLDLPTSGQYILNGVDVSSMDDNALAEIRNKTLGFVFQNFNLLPKRNLVDNISMPLIYNSVPKFERKKKALELLEKVKLQNYAKHFPTELSGGMKQRVAIARALVSNPKIILADEPTGNLDSKTSDEIMELFKELNYKTGVTIIMITHEAHIAEMTKRTIRIKDGVIVYDGPAGK